MCNFDVDATGRVHFGDSECLGPSGVHIFVDRPTFVQQFLIRLEFHVRIAGSCKMCAPFIPEQFTVKTHPALCEREG